MTNESSKNEYHFEYDPCPLVEFFSILYTVSEREHVQMAELSEENLKRLEKMNKHNEYDVQD